MKTAEDIEGYILKTELPYEELGAGTWVVRDQNERISNVMTLSGPVLVMQIKIAEIGPGNHEELFKLLLSLNAAELLYGAYGLEDDQIVLVEVLSLEHLDFANFLEATEALFMTVFTQHGMIARALKAKARAGAEAR
jgi:hypothetical protein